MSFEGLEAILKLPKALERLTIGERMYHISDIMPLAFHPNLLNALSPQQTTLKYWKHIGGGRYWSQGWLLRHYQENISSLTALETIELGPALGAKYTTQHLPPTLRKIRFLDMFSSHLDAGSHFFEQPFWSSTFQGSGQFHQIDVVLFRVQAREYWRDEDRRENINRVALKLRKQNTELRIYQYKHCERNWIPPYMYGEELPKEELSYVSSSPNMFDGQYYELVGDSLADEAIDQTESESTATGHGHEVD